MTTMQEIIDGLAEIPPIGILRGVWQELFAAIDLGSEGVIEVDPQYIINTPGLYLGLNGDTNSSDFGEISLLIYRADESLETTEPFYDWIPIAELDGNYVYSERFQSGSPSVEGLLQKFSDSPPSGIAQMGLLKVIDVPLFSSRSLNWSSKQIRELLEMFV